SVSPQGTQLGMSSPFVVSRDRANPHSPTAHQSPLPSSEPLIQGKRAAIAQAAYEAGFDCSDPSKLLHLIDAVVMANNKYGYPDQWDGAAAFQSTIYPDTWTSAHAARREQRTRSMLYDDAVKVPIVPAFAISATDIIRNLTTKPKPTKKENNRQSTRPIPRGLRTIGANPEPLGGSVVKKRAAAVQLPEIQSFKRPKLEDSSSQSDLIDLTQDENRRPTPSNGSRHMTTTQKHGLSRPSAQQRAAVAHQADAVAAGTGELLKKVVTRLKTSVMSINADREALRVRWEVDRRLQLIVITNHLQDLSDCFTRAEEGLWASVEVIQRFIM
ncbi:MAG: hypothetical protein Q9216_000193, partial [Gyalolechia sp. 2 TL-2023]